MLFPSSTERQIARRYLYRVPWVESATKKSSGPAFVKRISRTLKILTVLTGILLLGVEFVFFGLGYDPPLLAIAAAALPAPFMICLLLLVFSSFSTVAIFGVSLGVSALIVVLSITSGFISEIKQRIVGFNGDLFILSRSYFSSQYHEILPALQSQPNIKAVAPFIYDVMLVQSSSASSVKSVGVTVKGIDVSASEKILDLNRWLLPDSEGKPVSLSVLHKERPLNPGSPPLSPALLGDSLARRLNLHVGDQFRLVPPVASLDPSILEKASAPTAHPQDFYVAGLFRSGYDEYDRRFICITLKQAQAIVGRGDVISGFEVRLVDAKQANETAKALMKTLDETSYSVQTIEQFNKNLFSSLSMQKVVLSLVLFLIILVAAFNIVANLTMMVIDKVREISILKTMGLSGKSIAAIFRILGTTIGFWGSLLGVAWGSFTCLVVRRFGYHLRSEVYKIDALPVHMSIGELLVILSITLGISFCAALYPALRAKKLSPIDGLRYE